MESMWGVNARDDIDSRNVDTLPIRNAESTAMTPAEKLAKLLSNRDGTGGDISPTWLGEKLRERAGLKSGYNLVYRWARGGGRGGLDFSLRNQNLVEDILNMPRGWFSADGDEPTASEAPAPALDRPARAVLKAFLDSARAKEMVLSADETELLFDHHVDGEVTEDYFYHFVMTERSRRKAPTQRPNLATDAASKAGVTKRRKTTAPAKVPPKPPGGSR